MSDSVRDTPEPVSYTHLDVYKRQVLSGARVVLMADEGGVAKALTKQLAQAGAQVLSLAAGTSTEDVLAQLADWQKQGPIAGVYWLPALDVEGDWVELEPAAWHEALRRRVKALYAAMRQLYEGSPFLVSGTRLGGCHGYDCLLYTSRCV